MRDSVKRKIKNVGVGLASFFVATFGIVAPIYMSSSISRIHFIDTGNSDCILIQDEKNVLIDGGDRGDDELLVNYLTKEKIEKIDYIIVTHPHSDHIGGLDSIIENFNVGTVIMREESYESQTFEKLVESIEAKSVQVNYIDETSDSIINLSDDSFIELLNLNGGTSTNEKSIIALYTNEDDTALFMGDAYVKTELEILDELGDVDLLKVGHHGSDTSTSSEFLDKIKPEYAVITVGENNKYGHPDIETMEKLEKRDITVHRTDECGDIIFISTGNRLTTACEHASYNFGK